MRTLLISCLIHSILDKVQKYQKTGFLKLESSSRFCIEIINGAQISNLPASDTRLWLVEFYTRLGYSLEIKKKGGSSIDLDIHIHHSKVPSSVHSPEPWNAQNVPSR